MKMKMNLGSDGGKLIPSELLSDKQNKQDQQDNKTRTRTKKTRKDNDRHRIRRELFVR